MGSVLQWNGLCAVPTSLMYQSGASDGIMSVPNGFADTGSEEKYPSDVNTTKQWHPIEQCCLSINHVALTDGAPFYLYVVYT